MCFLTDINFIISQGVSDDVELEYAESLRELLDRHRIAYLKEHTVTLLCLKSPKVAPAPDVIYG